MPLPEVAVAIDVLVPNSGHEDGLDIEIKSMEWVAYIEIVAQLPRRRMVKSRMSSVLAATPQQELTPPIRLNRMNA